MHYNFVKGTNNQLLQEMANKWDEMPSVWGSVNILQETEWTINTFIYKVINECWDKSIKIGKLPINPESIDVPPRPYDIDTNPDSLKKWKRLKAKWHEDKTRNSSKFIQVKMILDTAKELMNFSHFCYPMQLDTRGRVYTKPALLTNQSADYAKSLLTFKYGKPIADEESFRNFAVAGSNLFGEADKESLNTRLDWVRANENKILASAKSPFDEKFWTNADKPFQFLAWCNEYKSFADTDFDASFITTLPLQMDCSNSGLQHYSALMRDTIGGSATNLVASEKPNDVYGIVANKLIEILKTKDDEMAKKWLSYGIDRKITKKPVMCLPYSLTMFTCRRYLAEHIETQKIDKNINHNFGDDLFKATQYLTPLIWTAIHEVIVGARQVMKYLKKITQLASSENLPVTWISPLNFPIQIACYEQKSKRVQTKIGDTIYLSFREDTKKIDKRKTSNKICADFIHSLDASLLQLAVVKAHNEGVKTFSVIHDSFGVIAPDVPKMSKAIREAFCEIYKQDILKKFSDDIYAMLSIKNQKKFPTIPPKGDLNLELVKDSPFFCI